ncbi:MAG: HXXEE domain-containing protein [Alphaproteobacteria bacterium]|nr:HXXEE domain-containing protein [Alphaproteobacteria bacterium]
MLKFIKYYALEIYTVLSMFILMSAGIIGDLSMIQKFTLVYIFLFILHEWEEMKYPGGFADLIAKMIGVHINEEMKRASRIPTGILLLSFTVVPFVFSKYPFAILPLAFLGLFEGLVHLFAIRLFKTKKFYSPGFVTAQMQFVVSVILFIYLIQNRILSGPEYLLGGLIMLVCFIIMQKTITMMIGYKYSNLFKNIKKQWQK